MCVMFIIYVDPSVPTSAGPGSLAQADASVLKRIANDASQTHMARLYASIVRAISVQIAVEAQGLFVTVPALNRAARSLRHPLHFAESATADQRSAYAYVGMSSEVRLLRGAAQRNIECVAGFARDRMESIDSAITDAVRKAGELGSQLDAVHGAATASAPDGRNVEQQKGEVKDVQPDICQQNMSLMTMNMALTGVACDCCKARCELRKCQRCGAVFYCSERCQRKDWNARHKHMCRSPREFRVGDLVQIMKHVEGAHAKVLTGSCELLERLSADSWRGLCIGINTDIGEAMRCLQTGTLTVGELAVVNASDMQLHPSMVRCAAELTGIVVKSRQSNAQASK